MFHFFKKSETKLLVDIHSHLVPAIDDGSDCLERSIELITKMKAFGYQKLYITPHIHPNYPNSEALIIQKGRELKKEITTKNIEIEIAIAAEYYTDETIIDKINSDIKLLTFGKNYVLVEVSFMHKPFNFEQIIFNLKAKGYQPILAHPERYAFLEGDISWLENLKQMEVLFQATIGSFSGVYGKSVRKNVNKLLKEDMIDFLGSDLHNFRQLKYVEKGLKLRKLRQLISSGRLLNNELI